MRDFTKVTTLGAIALLAVATTAPAPAMANESDFLSRFEANWSGGGKVLRRINESPWNVRCTMTQDQGRNAIDIGGTCRAAVFVSKAIGAQLTVDPATGVYSGTYIGASEGPAALTGRRSGDTLTLTITWAEPINGNDQATMIIRNPGDGTMQIQVIDRDGPGGPTVTTSDLTFSAT
jgi:hypothetical protein